MRVYVETYGCAANQGDASIIQGILLDRGHELVDSFEKADAIVMLTCTVIDTTQQRMLNRIRKLNKNEKIFVVAGCMASAQPDLIKDVAKNALLLPPRYIHCISDLLEGRESFYYMPKANLPRKIEIRLNIPISEGCLYNCSYCITKKARGKLTSFPLKELVKDAKKAIEKGCKEIRLTSQDTASYGMDTGESLAGLVNEIADIEGEFRIRIGMMHPLSAYKILDDLIEAYKNKKVYKFLHLPLQSASPKILKAMQRGYDLSLFEEIVGEFRKKIDGSIATDIIVAFPGEDEKDFEMTKEAIENIKPDVTNVTRFSPRPGTKAWKMKRLPTQIAKERSKIISCIANRISYERNKKCVGKVYDALILEEYKGWKIGKTIAYKSVFVKNAKIGEFVKVRAYDCTSTHLKCNLYK